jgi:glucose-6-phosphate isomerase
VDLSKNLVNRAVWNALIQLANEVGLAEKRDAMFRGERINVTENRSVLHTALRRPRSDSLVVDGADVVAQVHETLAGLRFTTSGPEPGRCHRQAHPTVVNIIGGSDSGR